MNVKGSSFPLMSFYCFPAVQYLRRRRTALGLTVSLLALALVVLTVGLLSATRTDNVPVAGFYPGIILSFGAFLGIVGIHLVENRRPMLVAAIIFISIGVIASFFCSIVDGIIASEFIDKRPVQEDMCQFYTSGSGYAYDSYYTEVTLIILQTYALYIHHIPSNFSLSKYIFKN
uniref:Transmembrane protein 255B n=1 Tax=Monopterus albus TaxID=43700 RepID=A0A3Q3K3H6_MONAL